MKISLKKFIVTVALCTLVIVGIYIMVYFGFKVDNKDFGPVGDSVGGILTPLLTLVTIVILYVSYNEQIKQNQEREQEFKKEIEIHHEFNVHESYMHSLDNVMEFFFEFKSINPADKELYGAEAFEWEAKNICGAKYQPVDEETKLLPSDKLMFYILDQLIRLHRNIIDQNFKSVEYKMNLLNNLYLFFHSSIEHLEAHYVDGYIRIEKFNNPAAIAIAHNKLLLFPLIKSFKNLRLEIEMGKIKHAVSLMKKLDIPDISE